MIQYGDISGRSGILGYDIEDDAITVYFKDGNEYRYTYLSAGRFEVEEMKQLATQGSGLNGYINQISKYLYDDTPDFR